MEAAGSIARFQREPLGRWISGEHFLVWSWSPQLGGMAAWGHPSEADVEQMFSLIDAYHRATPSCDVVTDVSRLESLSPPVYELLIGSVRTRLELFRSARRHAVIRPRGLLAAVAEGIFPMVGSGHALRTFDGLEAAFAWVHQPEGARARAELERLVDGAMSVHPEVRRLREYLSAHLRTATLPGAARALGTSERSLHRTLQQERTGFRAELSALRVEEARRLLADTDRKIDEIARAVGFASHAQLTTCFRRVTGEAPSGYRTRAQAERVGPA